MIWIVLKGFGAGGVILVGGSPVAAFVAFPVATLPLVFVVLVAVRIDMARQSEAVFLANLGWPFRRIAVSLTVLIVVLDGAVALLAS